MTEPEHDHTLHRWTCGCDPTWEGLKQAAEEDNIAIRVVHVSPAVPDKPDKLDESRIP
jgi:hypothetical protein